MKATTYLVTGASGFVGKHVCEVMRRRGFTVLAIVRRDDSALRALGVELVIGDLLVAGPWTNKLADVTHVIHCAGDAVFGNGPQYFRSNVAATQQLVQALSESGADIRRFVFVSTIGVTDRLSNDSCERPLDECSPIAPVSDYGRSKLEAEEIVRNSGFPFAIVRPAMVVGDDMRANSHFSVFARHALRGTLLGRIHWSGRFSVIHVDDVAEALLLCATHPDAEGRVFVCAGEAVGVGDFMELCRTGAKRIPVGALVPLIRILRRIVPFGFKAMMLPVFVASDAALRELGWRPTFSATAALSGVIRREKARFDLSIDPGGQTVITGAASGLGRALAEIVIPTRRHVLLVDRNREVLTDMVKRNPNCSMVVVDLAQSDAGVQVTQSEEWRKLPVRELFSCAGIGTRGSLPDVPIESQLDVIRVNVLSRLYLLHAVVRDMRRQHFGRIVMVSSSSAFQPLPYMAAYSASNAALLHLGEACAAEVADAGVNVLTVCPGGMQTNFQKSAGVKEVPGEKLMSPEEVARQILVAASRNKMTAIISVRAKAMAVVARLLPRRASVILWSTLMCKLR